MKKMIFAVAILTGLFATSNAQRNQKIDKPNQVRQGPTDKPVSRPKIERKSDVIDRSTDRQVSSKKEIPGSKPTTIKGLPVKTERGASIRVTEGSNNQRNTPPSKNGTTKPVNRKGSNQVAPKKN